MRTAGIAVALLASVSLCAACATDRYGGGRALAEYQRYAGPPIDEFRYATFDGWEVVGRDRVVLFVDVNQAYLLTVMQPCVDLGFTEHLAVSETLHAISRFEALFPERRERCPIDEIRHIDLKQLKADRAAARAAAKAAPAPN
jgi:hypothetical protein